jgi:uncharacterized protein (DUF1330 family)
MQQFTKIVVVVGAAMALAIGSMDVLNAQSPRKPAYVIAEVIEVIDPPGMQAYAAKVGDTLKPYGARVIVSGKAEGKEGEAPKGNIVVIAFNSLADAQRWYSIPPYSPLIAERQKVSKARFYIVEGVSP